MEEMLSFLIAETGLGDLESPLDVYWLNPDQVLDICKGGGRGCGMLPVDNGGGHESNAGGARSRACVLRAQGDRYVSLLVLR